MPDPSQPVLLVAQPTDPTPLIRRRHQRERARCIWVEGTPTFYVNGACHDGPFDAQSLLSTIVSQLTG